MNINYYITFDSPVPYRNIKIYPVSVKDYMYFSVYAQCLMLDKNSIPDPKIISMTDLEYIFHTASADIEKQPFLLWLDRLFSLCLRDEDFENIEKSILRYKYDDKGKPVFMIGSEMYSSKDFEHIKTIICEQNLVELPDENVSKEVRDSLEKAQEYKNRISDNKVGTLEDYIVSLATVTGWSLEYIYEMPVRKFIKSVKRYDNLIHYKIYLAASMSGMVDFKDKSFIKHWLTNLDDERKYGDVSVDLDEIQGKISLESAK